MSLTEETVTRAQKHDRRAMEAVLAEAYPAVFRLAHALTGRPGAARQVVHDVLRRCLRVMPKWRRGALPENWFYHHTVMTSRAVAGAGAPLDPRDDVLVTGAGAPATDPAYVAFVRAVRGLPPQQAEAFILHHGERLNTRILGVAMDCSQEAAAKHLEAATSAIQAVAGTNLEPFAAAMQRAYTSLVPPANAIQPAARRYVTRHLRPRQFKRVAILITLVALVAAGVVIWRSRDRVRSWLPFPSPQTQPSDPAAAPQ